MKNFTNYVFGVILDLLHNADNNPDVIQYTYENKGNYHQLNFFDSNADNIAKFRITDNLHNKIVEVIGTELKSEISKIKNNILTTVPIGLQEMPVGYYDE